MYQDPIISSFKLVRKLGNFNTIIFWVSGLVKTLENLLLLLFFMFINSCSHGERRCNLDFSKYFIKSGKKIVETNSGQLLRESLELEVSVHIKNKWPKYPITKSGVQRDVNQFVLACARIYHNIYEEEEKFMKGEKCAYNVCKILHQMNIHQFTKFAFYVFDNNINCENTNILRGITDRGLWKEIINHELSELGKESLIPEIPQSLKRTSLEVSFSTVKSDSEEKSQLIPQSPQKTVETACFNKNDNILKNDSIIYELNSSEESCEVSNSKSNNTLQDMRTHSKLLVTNPKIDEIWSKNIAILGSLKKMTGLYKYQGSSLDRNKNSYTNQVKYENLKSSNISKNSTEFVGVNPTFALQRSKSSKNLLCQNENPNNSKAKHSTNPNNNSMLSYKSSYLNNSSTQKKSTEGSKESVFTTSTGSSGSNKQTKSIDKKLDTARKNLNRTSFNNLEGEQPIFSNKGLKELLMKRTSNKEPKKSQLDIIAYVLKNDGKLVPMYRE